MSVELKSLITNQIVITEKLHLLNNDLVLLKIENNSLCEQLNLMKASKFQALDTANAEPIIPSLLNEQNLFLAKVIFIVAAVLLLSFSIYFFSTSVYTWFYKSIILKLMIVVDSLMLSLLNLMGCEAKQSLMFNDNIGNTYIVKLGLDNSNIEILIQSANSSNFVGIEQYIESLNSNITVLMSQLNAILTSAPSSIDSVANNQEIVGLIADLGQVGIF